ncbi:MAG: hypothetical protein WAT79_15640 [Saprospiraceae bacterium]
MKSILYLMLGFWLVVLNSSCHRCNDNENDCPVDISCTEIFVSIIVPLEFKNYSYNDLKYAQTIRKRDGNILSIHYYLPLALGPFYATIIDDNEMEKVKKSGEPILFKVYNDLEEEIYSEEFIIGHDCCHVVKISGKDKIIL